MAEAKRVNWSPAENEATVTSYFSMLKHELAGEPFVKSQENARLQARLNERSKAAVEYKYQNISAVLLENGWLYIDGYKPAANVQRELRFEVERQLRLDGDLERLTKQRVENAPAEPPAEPHDLLLADPPEAVLGTAEWSPRVVGIKRDYVYQDTRNRQLGLSGELTVVDYERRRLIELGEERLAGRVEHVSLTVGDGLGYDIRSFDQDGAERYIEVKTTLYARETPFFVSNNEVSASHFFESQFHLYRIFQFGSKVNGLYQLRGSLSETCDLRPVSFVGVPRPRG